MIKNLINLTLPGVLIKKSKLSESRFVFLVFFVLAALLILKLSWGAVTLTGTLFVAALALSFKLKNATLGFFLITVFVMPFFEPNKYYVVEVLRSFERVADINLRFKLGYFIGYGLTLPNIFTLVTLGLILRSILVKGVGFVLNNSVKFALSLAIFCFAFGIYTSLVNSPFPELSVVWLLQYMQCFFLAFTVYFIFQTEKKRFKFFYIAVLASLLFQAFVGFLQFFKQASLGLAVEYVKSSNMFSTGLDEIDTLYRISGTLVQPNQLALIVGSLIILLAPYMLSENRKVFWLATLSALSLIVLTQSRAIWLATLLVGILFFQYFKDGYLKAVKSIDSKKVYYYGLFLTLLLLPIIIPRVLLSTNSAYEGAGLPIRLKMLTEGWEAFGYSPLVGYGVGTNEWVLYSLFPDGVMSVFPAPVHLGFLQMLLEVGTIGLVLFLLPFVIIAKSIKNSVSKRNKKTKLYSFVFRAALILFGVYYVIHPYAGIIEFPYLGLHLGFGFVSVYLEKAHGKV